MERVDYRSKERDIALSKKFRYALIGCGFFAQNHLHAWSQNSDVELVATCDIDLEKASRAAKTFGGRAYSDVKELFANEKLDFVDIATTPPTHKLIVELAAANGVAAICQKPLAWEMSDAKAMVDVMAEKKLPFMVHENFRFQTPMRKIKEIIESGAIGKPFFGRISFRTAHDVYSAQSWLVESERMIIIDVAVHLFDLARYFMGEPETIFTSAHRINSMIKGEDSATILMHMKNGTCIVDASYETKSDHNTYPQTFVIIEGTKGSVSLSADYNLQTVSGASVKNETVRIPNHGWTSEPWNAIQDSVVNVNRHWIECLKTGKIPETSGVDTLKLLDITLGAYESIDTGKAFNVGSLLT
jgi:D-apiose dehydrogenase